MLIGKRVCVDGMKVGTVIDSYGGAPVDYEEIITIKFDDGGTDRIVNALIDASEYYPPRLEEI